MSGVQATVLALRSAIAAILGRVVADAHPNKGLNIYHFIDQLKKSQHI
jgi:hypothetical protein